MPRSLVRSVATRLRSFAKRVAEWRRMRRRRSPSAFAMGTSGHCLIEALAERRIPYRYLRQRETTNPAPAGLPSRSPLAVESYYFDGRLHNAGGRPRLADGETVQGFIQDKMRVKGLLRANGFSVPKGAAFAWRGKSRDVAGAVLDHLTSLTGRPDGETAR